MNYQTSASWIPVKIEVWVKPLWITYRSLRAATVFGAQGSCQGARIVIIWAVLHIILMNGNFLTNNGERCWTVNHPQYSEQPGNTPPLPRQWGEVTEKGNGQFLCDAISIGTAPLRLPLVIPINTLCNEAHFCQLLAKLRPPHHFTDTTGPDIYICVILKCLENKNLLPSNISVQGPFLYTLQIEIEFSMCLPEYIFCVRSIPNSQVCLFAISFNSFTVVSALSLPWKQHSGCLPLYQLVSSPVTALAHTLTR